MDSEPFQTQSSSQPAADPSSVEAVPVLSEEHAQELAHAIRLRTAYVEMMQGEGWKDLSAFLRHMFDEAKTDLENLTDLHEIHRCQMVVKVIRTINDRIDGVIKMGQAAQYHAAEMPKKQ